MWRNNSRDLISLSSITSSSLTHTRPLTCAVSCNQARIVPHPPDLVKWVRREGGFVHDAVQVAPVSPYGSGLVASDFIPRGSDLIGLPPHLPLRLDDSNDCSPSSAVLNHLIQQVPEELWSMKLGLKLLQGRAKSGFFWWPYISNLPETYSVPIFFQGEDVKNLQYAPLIYQVNKRCRFLLEFDKQVKQAVANLKPMDHPFTSQDFDSSSLGWAMSAVSSRAFRLHGKKFNGRIRKDVPMMLPLIDICNHSFHPNAKIIQDIDAGDSNMLVKVVAEKDIKRNDAVEINYGCLSNDFFLLDYGFVISGNPYDSVELKYDEALLDAASIAAGVSSPCFSSPASWQREILSALKLDGEAPDLKVTLGGPELVEGRLLAALRVLQASDVETACKHDLNTLQCLSAEAPLGTSIEVGVLRTVIALCVIILEHFPTKLMEDEGLLRQGVSSSSELAVKFRIQKKLSIVNVMTEMSKRVKLLLSKESPSAP
ncbi:hypothetical protein RND81_07G046300 [Saponaria officinalis]|uniref:SET domain-containing protein n=2 Tax=Saponaria officinalis TaxID=3572 RepID=A0AAW1JM51_SAPOF